MYAKHSINTTSFPHLSFRGTGSKYYMVVPYECYVPDLLLSHIFRQDLFLKTRLEKGFEEP